MKKKRRSSKAKNKEKAIDYHSALSGAVKDLEKEITVLLREKTSSKGILNKVVSAVNIDRQREKELQQKIAALIEREAKLNEKKKKLQVKIDNLSEKLNKISKIKSEMQDI